MAMQVERYDAGYQQFSSEVAETIRRETFDVDFGQFSWLTAEEFNRFVDELHLKPAQHVLDVASGSGGPALYLARRAACRVTGVDVNEFGVAAGNESAANTGLADRASFRVVDANAPLPFEADAFDGLTCIDAMNHFPRRLDVFREWRRVVRPGRRAVFTDSVVITGPVTSEELAIRSFLGLVLFVPAGVNEQLIAQAGWRLIQTEDVTANVVRIAARWREVRERYQDALLELEGAERFEALQKFYEVAHRLTSEGRMARIVYLVEKSR
jgi:SAM-dependent methyltransferase